jgi:phosphate transport system substrate-binding protein
MKRLSRRFSVGVAVTMAAVLVLLVAAVPALAATTMTGAGATFPLPLYQKWASDYNKKTGDKVSYSGGGSSFGITQIKAGSVDFGGSDAPLTKSALNKAGLAQFPSCVGGVAIIYRIPGIGAGKLRLTGAVAAKIFMGDITKWNSSAIKKLQTKAIAKKLPNKRIVVVHRSDGSGTTWIFTNYLGGLSAQFRNEVGIGKSVNWPTGVGGAGNPGVANIVKTTSGAIGYVEYAYAKQNRIAYSQLKNRSGKWVKPNSKTFAAAAANTKWSWGNGFYEVLVNKPGKTTWPITGATFVLVKRNQKSVAFGKSLLKFFNYAYTNGGAKSSALKLDYVPMPKNAVKAIQGMWKSTVKSGGKPCWP